MTDSTRVSRADNVGSVDQTGESTPSPAVLEPADAVSAQAQQVGNHSCAGTEEPVARVESRHVVARVVTRTVFVTQHGAEHQDLHGAYEHLACWLYVKRKTERGERYSLCEGHDLILRLARYLQWLDSLAPPATPEPAAPEPAIATLDFLWAAAAALERAFEARFGTAYMYTTHRYRDCASYDTPGMKIAELQDAINDARVFFQTAELEK